MPIKPYYPVHPKRPFIRNEETAAQIRRMAAVGLGKGTIAAACRITAGRIEKYIEDFEAGRRQMAECVAGAAMEQVRAGNPQMIMFMAKTRLGWSEHNVLEHTGTVNAVVSAKPLSREEFERRYLSVEDVTVSEGHVEDSVVRDVDCTEGSLPEQCLPGGQSLIEEARPVVTEIIGDVVESEGSEGAEDDGW